MAQLCGCSNTYKFKEKSENKFVCIICGTDWPEDDKPLYPNKNKHWSKEHIDYLISNWHIVPHNDVIDLLGRSRTSVVSKVNELQKSGMMQKSSTVQAKHVLKF